MSRAPALKSAGSASGAEAAQLALPLPRRTEREAPAPPVGYRHRVAGLFAGIGGIERGLHRAQHKTVLLCENEPAAKAVLETRFSGIRLHDDVRRLRSLPRDVSLIAAGFPCQDLSQAGMTSGIEGEQSGLVGEVLRLVKKHSTPWVLLENVPFMLQLAQGEAMHVITTAFEKNGYRWAYRVVDSRAFGRPQRRRRVYFLASRVGDPRTVLFADDAGEPPESDESWRNTACGFYWTEGTRGLGWAIDATPTLKGGSGLGIPSPPAIVMPDGRIVTPHICDAERLQGFPKNWTLPAERVAKPGMRWKLVGNAVGVDAAVWIGRRLARPRIPIDYETTPLTDHRHWPAAAWNVGRGRERVAASEWPQRLPYHSLEAFLRLPPKPLSLKAASGFLQRAEQSRLRFQEGFLDALRAHIARLIPPTPVPVPATRPSAVADLA